MDRMLTKFNLFESEFYPFGVSIDTSSSNIDYVKAQNDLIHSINVWLNECNIESLQCMQLSCHIWGFKSDSDRTAMLLAWL